MSNAESQNNYPYINSSNEEFFRDVENYLDNTTLENKSDLPPQAVPELPQDQFSDELNKQLELRDPTIIGLKYILYINKLNEDSINKRLPLKKMNRKTLKIIKKVNISSQSLLDKKLDDLK